jgi:hypothetical protein
MKDSWSAEDGVAAFCSSFIVQSTRNKRVMGKPWLLFSPFTFVSSSKIISAKFDLHVWTEFTGTLLILHQVYYNPYYETD